MILQRSLLEVLMIRLYTQEDIISSNTHIPLSEQQSHYLIHVMRLKETQEFLIFNERSGEWLASLHSKTKKQHFAFIKYQTKKISSVSLPDIRLYISLIKKENMDLILQKSTELGVKYIFPIISEHTYHRKFNLSRAQSILIEAAEQSERLDIPIIEAPIPLKEFLNKRDCSVPLYFLSERGTHSSCSLDASPVSFLIGPEGGFSQNEINLLEKQENAYSIHLKDCILRTETACLSILSIYRFKNLFL